MKKTSLHKRSPLFLPWLWVGILAFLSIRIGAASTSDWTGGTSDFNTPGNWNPSGVPGTSSNATFSNVGSTTVNLSSPDTIAGLTFLSNSQSYDFGGSTLTIDIDSSTAVAGLTQGAATTETFSGSVILANSGSSTAGQKWTLTAGTVDFDSNSSLSLGGEQLYVSGGGNLTFNGSLTVNANLLLASAATYGINGTLTGNGKIVVEATGSNTATLDIGGITNTSTGTLTLGSTSTSAASNDAVDFTAAQTFTNAVADSATTESGTLTLAAAIAGGGTVNLSGGVAINSTAANTETQAFSAATGNTLNVQGAISGGASTSFVQTSGPGTVIFSNAAGNTYASPTSVTSGTLLVENTSNSATGNGSVSVAGTSSATATLGGTGIIALTGTNKVAIGAYGVIAPGTSSAVGTLTIDAASTSTTALTLSSGTGASTLSFKLSTGNTSDDLAVTGGLSFFGGSSTLGTGNVINFTDLTSGHLSGLYGLISASSFTGLTTGGTATDGNTIITGGLLIGTGLSTYSSEQLQLNTQTDTIELDVTAAPEPTTTKALLLLGPVLLALVLRRKGRNSA